MIDMDISFESATIEYARNSTRRKMTSQVLREQSVSVESFVSLLRAYTHATRELNAQLTTDHGLTISDYEVLLRLSRAPDRRMRRVDLAEQVLLTASGITRLLDGLEGHGYVARGSCDSDRRVVYAVLTNEGLEKLRQASDTHVAQIEEYFTARYDASELGELNALLARIDGGDPADCTA
jgi:DNA-binding MarR family transcriptional regulator